MSETTRDGAGTDEFTVHTTASIAAWWRATSGTTSTERDRVRRNWIAMARRRGLARVVITDPTGIVLEEVRLRGRRR
jgi:hypothetical protein